MRTWTPSIPPPARRGAVAEASDLFARLVAHLGEPEFGGEALRGLAAVVPTASLSVYRIGCARPQLYFSAAQGVADLTRQCWHAYLLGAQHEDLSWGSDWPHGTRRSQVVHVRASEVSRAHRAQVYEAHGMAERLSIAERASDGSVFALNFYRHEHQRPLGDRHLADFSELSAALLALAQKHIALVRPAPVADARRQRLLAHAPDLTGRELDVCLRLLQGLTQDGTAADLGLSAATVKTYRNRAFARLGIQHRNQLFALIAG